VNGQAGDGTHALSVGRARRRGKHLRERENGLEAQRNVDGPRTLRRSERRRQMLETRTDRCGHVVDERVADGRCPGRRRRCRRRRAVDTRDDDDAGDDDARQEDGKHGGRSGRHVRTRASVQVGITEYHGECASRRWTTPRRLDGESESTKSTTSVIDACGDLVWNESAV
jgi:hypothetical protein